MKVLLLGGSAHGQEREVDGAPSHVYWQELPPLRLVQPIKPSPPVLTSDLPEPETYVRTKFVKPGTPHYRVAWVYQPQRHLADQLLNAYLRGRWIADGMAAADSA